MIVSASSDRTLRVWNTTTGTILREMGDFRETPAQIDVCWTPAGRHFALARSGAEATLWDIDEGKLLLKLPGMWEPCAWRPFAEGGSLCMGRREVIWIIPRI